MREEKDITKSFYIWAVIFLILTIISAYMYARELNKPAAQMRTIRLNSVIKISLTPEAMQIIERYKSLEIDKGVLTMPLYEFAFKIGPILNLTETNEVIENNVIEVLNAPQD